MKKVVLNNFTYFEGDKAVNNHAILIENGNIISVGDLNKSELTDAKVIDLKGNYLTPGFVDLQVNGGEDIYLTDNLTTDGLRQICKDHLLRGTTSLYPTIITTSFENIIKAIEITRECMQDENNCILGLHVEGPFINEEKRGTHDPQYIRKPTDEELSKIIEVGKGAVKKITIAPEYFSAKQIGMLKDAGILVSAGHSAVTCERALQSFDEGVACLTHLYNAMPVVKGREIGLTGAAFVHNTVYAGIIVDNYHCSDEAVRLAYKNMGDRLFLISDATFIGTKNLVLGGINFIYDNKRYINSEGNLAGTNITMHDAVINTVEKVGLPLHTALDMAAKIPLKVIGNTNLGRIQKGYKADFVVLSKTDLSLEAVIKNGEVVK